MITQTYDETQWQLVPKVPTPEQLKTAEYTYETDWPFVVPCGHQNVPVDPEKCAEIYQTFLAAAPPAPSVQQLVVKMPVKARITPDLPDLYANIARAYNEAIEDCCTAIEQAGGKVE